MTVSLANLNAHRDRVQVDYSTRIRPRWRLDVDAIEAACEYLGVTERVRIYLSESKRGRWLGSHHWDAANSEHVVMVCRRCTPAGASRVLWHELTHASQQECGEDITPRTSATSRSRLAPEQYRQLPGEAEAERNEQLARAYPLATELALIAP